MPMIDIAAYEEQLAQQYRNTEYYRGLLIECGKTIGKPAFTRDDGSIQQDVLCAKIPELVKELVTKLGETH